MNAVITEHSFLLGSWWGGVGAGRDCQGGCVIGVNDSWYMVSISN